METFEITHRRKVYYKNSTIGTLHIDGRRFCYTLEDTVRGFAIKVLKYTAIPPNKEGYKVSLFYSNKFKRDMLCLHTANDGFTIKRHGIKFQYVYSHGGNTDEDTTGCVLVGFNRDDNKIYDSAESKLFNLIKDKIDKGFAIRWKIINIPNGNIK